MFIINRYIADEYLINGIKDLHMRLLLLSYKRKTHQQNQFYIYIKFLCFFFFKWDEYCLNCNI